LEGARVIDVQSAQEMQRAVESEFHDADALVMAAAVADARPTTMSDEKIKKNELQEISLTRNEDILAGISALKRPNQVLVGFAAETSAQALALGETKLRAKGADYLYVNDVSGGAIFGSDQTSGTLIGLDIAPIGFNNVDKFEVAEVIIKEVAHRLERVHG
jgi:phosphopantothenoylcysteine decarboxylase/phosphopantothenate--cysteine ligase